MLSSLDESGLYTHKLYLEEAENDKLILADTNNNRKIYTDMSSVYGSCNFGHCNPEIMSKIRKNIDTAPGFYPKEAELYAEWLVKKLALPQHRVLFQVGGSHAVSTAFSLAQSRKSGKIAFLKGSFHGLGWDALLATSIHKKFALQNHKLYQGLSEQFIEIDLNNEDCLLHIQWDTISCFIFEPIQGANGYIPVSEITLKKLIIEAKKHSVSIIADEIQAGYYRHGHLSVTHNLNITPDILLFGKSMTNGLTAFSAVIYSKEFHHNLSGNFYLAHTYQFSAIGAATAYAVAQYIEENDIATFCNRVTQCLQVFVNTKLARQALVSEVHVIGPSLSFKVKDSKKLVLLCLEHGVIILTGGVDGDRIRIAPPITISINNLEKALYTVNSCLTELSQTIKTEINIA